MGYGIVKGDPKIKNHDDHWHTNPHPVHGGAFGGKQAAPFKRKPLPAVKKLAPAADDSNPAGN